LITGANRGLGLETARQLGRQGITVLVGARDWKKAHDAEATLKAEGIDAHAIKLDVTSTADHKAVAQAIEKQFGKLDILVNNAAIGEHAGFGMNTTATISEAELRTIFETNFFGVVALTQTLLPLIKRSDAGRIVNVSSLQGSMNMHTDTRAFFYSLKPFGYDASKTALNVFTIHIAHALKETKIKVNAVHPGWVKTDMGSDAAPLEIPEGAKTQVAMALLGEDGPTGSYIHAGETIPW